PAVRSPAEAGSVAAVGRIGGTGPASWQRFPVGNKTRYSLAWGCVGLQHGEICRYFVCPSRWAWRSDGRSVIKVSSEKNRLVGGLRVDFTDAGRGIIGCSRRCVGGRSRPLPAGRRGRVRAGRLYLSGRAQRPTESGQGSAAFSQGLPGRQPSGLRQ